MRRATSQDASIDVTTMYSFLINSSIKRRGARWSKQTQNAKEKGENGAIMVQREGKREARVIDESREEEDKQTTEGRRAPGFLPLICESKHLPQSDRKLI